MDRKRKLPQTALQLYVKLYCKRKDRSDSKYYNNLIEATKSWVSLSQEEKQHFIDKYKEYRLKYKNSFASYLQSAVPYMKKKCGKRISDSIVTENKKDGKSYESKSPALNESHECITHNQTKDTGDIGSRKDVLLDVSDPKEYLTCVLSEPAPPKLIISDSIVTENKKKGKSCETESSSLNESHECITHNQTKDTGDIDSRKDVLLDVSDPQEYLTCVLSEPAPPKLMSGQELFELIKGTDEENESTWRSLSNLAKRRYRTAVLNLKKEYINNYKAYLESLPSNELFDYYNKII